eukprot:1241260-Amorphochlora_amoeboformis.AAC.1
MKIGYTYFYKSGTRTNNENNSYIQSISLSISKKIPIIKLANDPARFTSYRVHGSKCSPEHCRREDIWGCAWTLASLELVMNSRNLVGHRVECEGFPRT